MVQRAKVLTVPSKEIEKGALRAPARDDEIRLCVLASIEKPVYSLGRGGGGGSNVSE